MNVRFCQDGKFTDHDLPAVPSVDDTIRTFDGPGQLGPRLSWVRNVVWSIPPASDADGNDVLTPVVTVEVHLTSERPKGR